MAQTDILVDMCAIHPVVQCLRSLLIAIASNDDISRTNVLTSKVLEYMQRLPFISIEILEPLLSLSSGKVRMCVVVNTVPYVVLYACINLCTRTGRSGHKVLLHSQMYQQWL